MTFGSLLATFIALGLGANPALAADAVFDSNGVRIRYVTTGEGEPILLIAVDLRGHGQSDKPHEPEAYGPEMAEDVVRLLDHLELLPADRPKLTGEQAHALAEMMYAGKDVKALRLSST